ncbi:hypothetical protein DENSPDRAFT_821206 [Dentipellis sp. KUC8613]|nr:hypothetical protein DENSPDRAFT_821206 [Dentipellis sp. KUC8613]
MPLAPVDNKGTQLFYEDSGPLDGIPYTTMVIVHGSGYHSAIFHKMLPFAAQNQLRMVLVNRRDYPGSTPESEEELKAVAPGATRESQSEFVAAKGIELAGLLSWFIKTQGIPAVQTVDGKVKGGIVLVMWSSSNTALFGLLSHLDKVPEDTRSTVGPYLRTCFHYDGPQWSSGFSDENPYTIPFRDPSRSLEERTELLVNWLSGYYPHPDVLSRSPDGLTKDIITDLPDKTPTLKRMTPEEVESVSCTAALSGIDWYHRLVPQELYNEHMRKALFDEDMAAIWPHVKVKYLHGSQSLPEMVACLWDTEKVHSDVYAASGPRTGRTVEFHFIEGVNHYAHWDMPEKLTSTLAELM